MGNIQANKRGKVQAARKQLKTYLAQFRDDWGSATAAQKSNLLKAAVVALIRIELYRLGRLEDID